MAAIPALEICNLSKRFGSVVALDDVSMSVAAGGVRALIGANGSGKSTLIKLLAGIYKPEPGAEASTNGVKFAVGSAEAAHAAGLRFVHQDLGIVREMSTLDNLGMGGNFAVGRGARIRWKAHRARAVQTLHSLGYDIPLDAPAHRLAPSARTAVAVARALHDAADVRVLVLDEPTAAMPDPEVGKLFQLVNRLKERGIAIVYVSHHFDEIFAIADTVTVLRDGRDVLSTGLAGLSQQELIDVMVDHASEETPPAARRQSATVALTATGLSGRVLRDFDLSVHAGEILGIAGISGSGREEVAGLLFGSEPRISGKVSVNGDNLPNRADKAVRRGIGLVPADRRDHGVLLDMDLRENLTLPRVGQFFRRGRLQHKRELRDAVSWLDRLKVKRNSPSQLIATLSGGNQQKVVIGRWLRLRPSVLILDEPTQGVDVGAKQQIHELLDQAADDGMAVVICSSDDLELERLCDRVIVLQRGREAGQIERPAITRAAVARLTVSGSTNPTTFPGATREVASCQSKFH